MELPEIIKFTESLDKEAKAIEHNLLRLTWYMRGGITLDEAYQLSFEQREMINEIVKENFEYTKDTGQPFI